jgi:DNA-binding transcriptional LysR family regulator
MMAEPLLELSLLRTFVLLVEEASVTRVAKRLNRSQPAITLQLHRLEQLVGRKLFEANLRRPKLTSHGETLLCYARKLLDLDNEARARLRSDEVSGRVVLGCPDLYAAFLLPRILARFQSSYPNVEVTVYCALSRKVAEAMENNSVDVALVTHMPDVNPHLTDVTLLRREKLVWLGAEDGSAYRRDPLPVAMLPDGNRYRRLALSALDAQQRAWRIACVSESIAGLQAMALSDVAVIVLAQSVEVRGLRQFDQSDGLPELPEVELALWHRQHGFSAAADHLASYILGELKLPLENVFES